MAKIINENGNDELLFLVVTDDADTTTQDDDKSYILRKESGKIFLQSKNINIFPCSRRGQHEIDGIIRQYDPEARLNTERTNRLHTAVNGFTDSFIKSYIKDTFIAEGSTEPTNRTTGTLTFSLAGYQVEAKNFDPDTTATALGLTTPNIGDKIYAYLRLNTGVSLDVENYFTEILYRQSTINDDLNYLDVTYRGSYIDDDGKTHNINDEFFVGISFVKEKDPIKADDYDYTLPVFSYTGSEWELVQTSLLPKIEHGDTKDSIVVAGNATFSGNNSTKTTIGTGTVEAETSITTPVLKVDTVESYTADVITVQVPLDITSTGQTKIAGEVVVDNTLTAEEDLVAKHDINAGGNLSVGTDSDTTTGTITAKKLVNTPTLKVDTITSDNTEVVLNTTLKVATINSDTGLTITDTTLTVPNSDDQTKPISLDNKGILKAKKLELYAGGKANITTLKTNTIECNDKEQSIVKIVKNTSSGEQRPEPTLIVENGTVSAASVKAATELKAGNINTSTDALTVTKDAVTFNAPITVNDTLTAEKLIISKIDDNGEEKGEVVTPTLRVNRLTTNLGNITVDDKNLIVTKNLEVLAAKAIDEEDRETAATATIDKAVIGQLEVKKDTSKLTGSTGGITAGNLTVSQYINVGSPAIPTQTAGDIVAKNSIFAENHIAAKNTIKAPAIYQTVNAIEKKVPYIDIVEQDGGQWQLQISRVNKIEN